MHVWSSNAGVYHGVSGDPSVKGEAVALIVEVRRNCLIASFLYNVSRDT